MLQTFVGLLLASFILSGCASVLSSSEQDVSINSNVKGASISLNGRKIGVTPFIGKVPRQAAHDGTRITLSKKGYVTQTNILSSDGVNPMFWLNALVTVGSVTDFATGAMWQISPSNIYIEMKKKKMSSSQRKSFRHSLRVKDFVFKNYHHLLRENAGKGAKKYFESLARIVKSKSLSTVQRLFSESGSAERFAESLLK